MSGINLVNRIRRFRKNARGQGGSARQNNRQRSCSENAVSLRRLIKSTDTSDNKSSAEKTNAITKYFLKGSPSITQEIDYLFEIYELMADNTSWLSSSFDSKIETNYWSKLGSSELVKKYIPEKTVSTKEVLKIVIDGNLREFLRIYEADESRLNIQNDNGASPAHKAAEHNRINILDFVVSHGGDINLADRNGNTPLHLAVLAGNVDVIDFLLKRGADGAILNGEQLAPIHLAVEEDCISSLKALLAHDKIDPNLPGEKGYTALHYCAYKDRDECAIILLQHGARPCAKCKNGFFPINIAAKCASADTLEVLIKHVEGLGYKREDVLTYTDKENNMPLHCAVNSGDLKAVKVCLSAGAPVDSIQEDKSTPLHFACAQGSVDMVRLMYELQPERFDKAMKSTDVLKMTPIHRAALFDHVAVVEFLIKLNADVNVQDIHERTPLLLASSKGGWRTVHLLLQNNADISIKDKENRNFLHLAIKYGSSIAKFGCAVLKGLRTLLNERDVFGCTPLHYASKEGHLVAIDDLIKFGASINPKDNDKKSPLHFAAKYGRYNTCKRLLESDMGPNIINETDGDGLSALHIAAETGYSRVVTLLMQKGAYVTKDDLDNTPLHLAAANGYTRSMRLLLTVYPNLLDLKNKQGDTALHIAAHEGHASTVELLMCMGASFLYNSAGLTFIDVTIQEKHTEVGFAIVRHGRWEEALGLCSTVFVTPMNGLVQFLPEVSVAALDRCITRPNVHRKHKSYYVNYNYRLLESPCRFKTEKDRNAEHCQPMLTLNTMVRHGRVQCLSHPLSEAYLKMKWRAYGSWIHFINLIIYVIFLALLTVLVTTCTYQLAKTNAQTVNITTNSNMTTTYETTATTIEATSIETFTVRSCEFTTIHRISVIVVIIFCCLNMLKEVLQMIQQRIKYFLDPTNYLEWVLYVSAMLFIVPFLTKTTTEMQWEIGAFAIFLAWFNLLLFLRRFDIFGIYVVMFLEILRTLLQVLCVFSILLIAFGMAFFVLMNKEESAAHSTVGLSLLRTTMMMLELDFMSAFSEPLTDSDPTTLYFGGSVIVLLVAFVLLMPILLINLLIGLAVGDIESVLKQATLKRLAMQVQLHTDIERKLPWKILDIVDKPEQKCYPNKFSGYMDSFWSKLSFSADSSETSGNASLEQQDHLYEELFKQKQRMKEMSNNMTKQYDLLRLIVQKMEIHTEDDNRDEGDDYDTSDIIKANKSKWTPTMRKALVRQSAVVTAWKNSMDKTSRDLSFQ